MAQQGLCWFEQGRWLGLALEGLLQLDYLSTLVCQES
jgi:hypothetical protein